MRPATRPEPGRQPWVRHPLARAVLVLLLLYLFLVGVNGLGSGFEALGSELLDRFFAATANPFLGLVVGILATTLVQSSSVTTALIVGLVAAPDNPLPVAHAIPMVMGANIGTTVTNTLASLAHMTRKEEFRRAFAVATCHDFFNYIAVVALLPLELLTGYLGRVATVLADQLGGFGGATYESPAKHLIESGTAPIGGILGAMVASPRAQAGLLIAVSALLIFGALVGIVSTMRSAMRSRVEALVTRAFENRPLIAMIVGTVTTVMVQSSSITTSLLVPLAGAGVLTLRQAFPITLGANVGTTVTALLAALAATGPNAEAGLVIALVHLVFNTTGILLIYPFEPIRRLPLRAARRLADIAVRSRTTAILYVVLMFYAIPAVLALLGHVFG